MSSPWFSRIQKCFAKRPFSATCSRAKWFRPEVQTLEERSLLSNLAVVPISTPTDATDFHSLTAALAASTSGDLIRIYPYATPDAGPVNVGVPNLTIEGATSSVWLTPSYDLVLNASNIVLSQLNLGTVQATSGVSNETISFSQLVSFTEVGAVSGVGFNTLESDAIRGFVDLQGNSGLAQVTSDTIKNNSFSTINPVALKLANANLTTIKGNSILSSAPSSSFPVGIAVHGSSDQMLIANNDIQMTSSGSVALYLTNSGGAVNVLGVKVLDNTLDTGGLGTGMSIGITGTGDGMVVVVQGNDFLDNKFGAVISGVPGPAGAGHIDLGGAPNSLGASLGDNNFRGFDGQGRYSIGLYNSDFGVTVSAEKNFFSSGILPHSTVSDGTIHAGTGVVDVTALQPRDLVGRVSSTGQWWVAQSSGSSFSNQLWDTWNPNVTWVDVQTGNFTGDGKTDIVGRVLQTGQWWVGVRNSSGGFTTSLWTTWNPNVTWVDVKVGDFTGDGRDDIAGRVLQTGQWWVAESTGSSFTNSLWTTWNPNVTWVDVNVGNFDGKIQQDIVGRVLESGQWWVAQSSGASFNNSLWATWNPNVTWVDVKVGDFNGDGMSDIVGRVLQSGQWWVGLSNGTVFSTSLWTTWNPNVTWVDVQVGNFNSLGVSSIVGRVLESGQWWVGESNGTTFSNSLWATWSTAVTWVDVQVGDFNGDGLSDITGRVLQTGQWWTGLSNGAGFTTSLWDAWNSAVNWTDVRSGDYVM